MRACTTPMPTSSTGWCTAPQWAFAPRVGGRLQRVVAVGRRVPDAVAQRLARVPVKPPVHHLPAHARHGGAHRHVGHPVLEHAPAGLAAQAASGRAGGPRSRRSAGARSAGSIARASPARQPASARRSRSAARDRIRGSLKGPRLVPADASIHTLLIARRAGPIHE